MNDKTTDQFKKEVYDLVKDEYIVLGEYVNNKTKIKIKHNTCNNIYDVTPHNFLNNNTRCPRCSGKYKRTHEDFLKEVYDLVGDEYTVLNTYKSDGTKKPDKIKFLHTNCKNIFEMRAHDFLKNGHRCPVCANKKIGIDKLLTNEEFLNKIKELNITQFTFLEKYTGCRNKILVRCNICNKEFKITPKHILYDGHLCPYCKRSIGEEKVAKWLEDNKIKYIWHCTDFKDCKYKQTLEFDFYLEEYNLCIECDGIQHFKKMWYDYTEDDYLKRIKRDNIKNEYCKKNNISLLRIPYTENNNINNILNKNILEVNNEK